MKRGYVILIALIVVAIIIVDSSNNNEYKIDAQSEVTNSETEDTISEIYVQVTGAVAKPGLYAMNEGDRINDLLLEADALNYNSNCINLAQKLVDEQNLYVPPKSEQCPNIQTIDDNGIVNINSASSYELQTISGIGEAKAQSIVEYREQHGSFLDTADLVNVEGISDSLLQSISAQISLS